MQAQPKLNTFYRHIDGGFYFTNGVATSSVDLSDYVIYTHVFPFEQKTWIRPVGEWTDQRFEEVTPLEVTHVIDSTEQAAYQALVTANKQKRKQAK